MRSCGYGKIVSGCVIVVVAAALGARPVLAKTPAVSPVAHALQQSVAAWMSVVAFLADDDDDRGPRHEREHRDGHAEHGRQHGDREGRHADRDHHHGDRHGHHAEHEGRHREHADRPGQHGGFPHHPRGMWGGHGDRGGRPLPSPGMGRPPHGMGPMPRPSFMHDHASRQLDEIIARLGRIEERLGIGSPGHGPHSGAGPRPERPQTPSRPEVSEEMRRAMEQRMQEGRKRMEEAHDRMEEAKKKFREMEERIRRLEAELQRLRAGGGDASTTK